MGKEGDKMRIQERIENLIPDSKVEWYYEKLELVVYTNQEPEIVKSKICKELSQCGLLRAIETIRIKSRN